MMHRNYLYLLGAALLVAAAANAEEHRPITVVESTASGPLTLNDAKQIVAQSLLENGRRQLRAGAEKFDGNGNVEVAIVSWEGIAYGHVLVDGRTHHVVAASARSGTANHG